MLKKILGAALIAGALSTPAISAEKYVFDASHSQIIFSYDHLGFSTSFGMFSGFEGEAMLDVDNPAASSVTVEFGANTLIAGWKPRAEHLISADFFNAEVNPLVTFKSTLIETTGDDTAKVTGDLQINGITKPVTLDVKLNQMGDNPLAGKPWAGFDATTTVLRSEFGMEKYTPFISDEVKLMISVEMSKAE
ncbi:MAG: YceI family protein [Hyphomicrobiales bacterium]